MAYATSLATVRKIADIGLYAGFGAGTAISQGAGSMWYYLSSHASSDCGGVTGFFSGCGAQPSSGASPASWNMARSLNCVGMKPGDLVAVAQTSAGTNPAAVTWHCVKNSTF